MLVVACALCIHQMAFVHNAQSICMCTDTEIPVLKSLQVVGTGTGVPSDCTEARGASTTGIGTARLFAMLITYSNVSAQASRSSRVCAPSTYTPGRPLILSEIWK